MQKKLCTVFVSRVVEKLQRRSEPLEHAPKSRVDFHEGLEGGLLEGVNIPQLACVDYLRAET